MSDRLAEDIVAQELVLDMIQHAELGTFSREAFRAKTSDALGFELNQMVMRLSTFVLADQRGHGTVTFPATTWDMAKARALPKLGRIGRWYLRRHPVREHSVGLKSYLAFPKADIPYPAKLGPIRLLTMPTYPYPEDDA